MMEIFNLEDNPAVYPGVVCWGLAPQRKKIARKICKKEKIFLGKSLYPSVDTLTFLMLRSWFLDLSTFASCNCPSL